MLLAIIFSTGLCISGLRKRAVGVIPLTSYVQPLGPRRPSATIEDQPGSTPGGLSYVKPSNLN